MVFTKLPRGRDLKENDPNGGGGAFSRSRKQLAKADPAPSIFGVVLLFVHRGIWRTGVHDIGIVFPGAREARRADGATNVVRYALCWGSLGVSASCVDEIASVPYTAWHSGIAVSDTVRFGRAGGTGRYAGG